MRSLFWLSALLWAWPLHGANQGARVPVSLSPALPVAPVLPPALAPSPDHSASAVSGPQSSLAESLGVKPESSLSAAALEPVGEALLAPAPGPAGTSDKAASDADWGSRFEPRDRPLSIVLAAGEAVPFVKTGGLADVVDAVSRGLARRGHRVTVLLPKYASIASSGHVLEPLPQELSVPVAGQVLPARLWRTRHQEVDVVFIDNDRLFEREGPYGGPHGVYPDNDERFIFFSRAVLEAARALDLKPDIINAHDWHAALIAPLLKLGMPSDPILAAAKTVLTIHNISFQGDFEPATLAKAGFGWADFTFDKLAHRGRFNFLKAGAQYADALTTVSPTYARQIQEDPEFGMGLEPLLRYRSADLRGILNGVDPELWDPRTDPNLERPFGINDVRRGKALNKLALQRATGLWPDPRIPMFGVASRLTLQKGIDVIAEAVPRLVGLGGQLVVTGSGEEWLAQRLADLARLYPRQVFVHAFDQAFVRSLYAASDFLLMPSRFEPCGLSQMEAQRYGALPLVTRTGGLADTVVDGRDGFFLRELSADALAEAIASAVAHQTDPAALARTRRAAMEKDSSWEKAVGQYLQVFAAALSR